MYLPHLNALYIRGRIMYKPAYIYGGPPEVNYGALGRQIAAGILRGFDEDGRKFDGDGDIANWWTNESRDAYAQRQKCAHELYKNATTGGVLSATYQTDMIGERSVYHAYKESSKTTSKSLGKVGSLTSDQLFYIT